MAAFGEGTREEPCPQNVDGIHRFGVRHWLTRTPDGRSKDPAVQGNWITRIACRCTAQPTQFEEKQVRAALKATEQEIRGQRLRLKELVTAGVQQRMPGL